MKEVDSMKCNRRILSLLLAICMVAVLLPTAVFADVSMGTAIAENQVVSYADKEWIVIDNNSNELVLLLKTPEAPIAYNASGLSNAWDTSDAKAWCDSFKTTNNIPFDVFFLSHKELTNDYGINSTATLCALDAGGNPIGWWLRCTDELDVGGELFGLAISDAGFVGTPHVATNYGARPAVKIPASNIAIVENGRLVLVDESAFTGVTIGVEVADDFSKVTATYSGAKGGKVYVVLTNRQDEVLASTSADVSAANGSVQLSLPEGLMGRYTVRAFNVENAASSAVKVHDFAIEDSHGNVVEWNVNVGGDVSANFNIVLSDKANEADDTKIVVSYNGTTKEISKSEWQNGTTTDGAACVKLPVDMIAPHMNDVITIQVVADGTSGGEQTFTIREYAEAIINGNFDDNTKNLAKHMLNYGAKSQTYFNYKTDDLANKTVGVPTNMEAVPNDGKKADKSGDEANIQFYGASLVLNSKTTLRFYFTLTEGKSISDFKFGEYTVHSRTTNGTLMYFVDIDDIAPHQLNSDRSVAVTDSQGNDILTVTYNPMWYIQRQYHSTANSAKFKNLLQAMYNYYLAADIYAN